MNWLGNNNTVRFWAVCDIVFICLYTIKSAINGNVPFVTDLANAKNITASFGNSMPIVLVGLGIVVYVSILINGIILLKLKKLE